MTPETLPPEVHRALTDPDQRIVFALAYNSASASGRDDVGALSAAWDAIRLGWFKTGRTWVRRNQLKVQKTFNPDQPRDVNGRWTGSGVDVNSAVISRIREAPGLPMGDRYVSARDLGVPVSGPLNNPLRPPNITSRLLDKTPVTELSFANVSFAQNYLDREKVISMMSGELERVNTPLTVLRQDDRLFIVDGTHRGAAMFLGGQLTFNARIVDARPPKARR